MTASEWRDYWTEFPDDPWLAEGSKWWEEIVADLASCERERDEYKRDASVMAATQCIHVMRGDDYGNAVCPKESEVKALREQLRLATISDANAEEKRREKMEEGEREAREWQRQYGPGGWKP